MLAPKLLGRNNMRVIIRTHGGLGNQLFQVFFGRLFVQERGASELLVIHDDRYPHRFQLSKQFKISGSLPLNERVLSGLRIPKLISRTGIAKIDKFSLFKKIYLDGYFQTPEQYTRFNDGLISDEVWRLRHEFAIDGFCDRATLVHLRLGDFFGRETDEVSHLERRLDTIPTGSHIISNRDDLLSRDDYSAVLAARDCLHIQTDGEAPENVLRLMCRYHVIESNNSTLAFWASVLTGSDVSFTLSKLSELQSRLLVATRIKRGGMPL